MAAAEFVPLGVWLRGPVAAEPHDADAPVAAPDVPPDSVPPEPPVAPEVLAAQTAALREVRRFRAAVADAVDAASAALVRELAYAVLGRELLLAPADLAALAARIGAEHGAAPVEVHHAPGDAPPPGVAAVADPRLGPGDLLVRFADGTVDASFGVRLAVALEAWS